MAAISVGNLAAPFRNKLQLGTIIVVAFLVILFRVSGGGIAVQSKSNPAKSGYSNRTQNNNDSPALKLSEEMQRIDGINSKSQVKNQESAESDSVDPLDGLLDSPTPPQKNNLQKVVLSQ